MSEWGTGDLAVVIPTRNRWPILSRTLAALEAQTMGGFEVIVVVDGEDQEVPDLGVKVLVQPKAGPGVARNTAVAATDRPLVLLLGGDIIPTPTLVEQHLRAHNAEPAAEVAVLGSIRWHDDVATNLHNRWLDWSGGQVDYRRIDGDGSGWGRFCSSNASLKRTFFLDAGGFDPEFVFHYEDLDLAYRLHERGMVLRYRADAVGLHYHRFGWPALTRRFYSRGEAERIMARKHDWFQPYFLPRVTAALERQPVSAIWPRLASKIEWPAPVRDRLRGRATQWYHQQLAPALLGAWNGSADVEELREYLGADFDEDRLLDHRRLVDSEEEEAGSEAEFYRTSQAYLYDLTMFALWGIKEPYLAALRRLIRPGARVLDYGCGIGTDGLRLLGDGYQVEFADFDNPSTRYLKWRLDRRGSSAPVHDVDGTVPSGFDLAYSFDVIEHVDDPFAFVTALEQRASVVMVNLLETDPDDTHLHKPLPIRELLDRATRKGLLFYRCFNGRSHLIAYRSSPAGRVPSGRSAALLMRGRLERAVERACRLPTRA